MRTVQVEPTVGDLWCSGCGTGQLEEEFSTPAGLLSILLYVQVQVDQALRVLVLYRYGAPYRVYTGIIPVRTGRILVRVFSTDAY